MWTIGHNQSKFGLEATSNLLHQKCRTKPRTKEVYQFQKSCQPSRLFLRVIGFSLHISSSDQDLYPVKDGLHCPTETS